MSQSFHYTTTVLIAGAGPAGASTSVFLSKEKIKHIIIDKAVFPRDKICGDALSAKSVGMLKRLSPAWKEHFLNNESKAVVSTGMQFIAPDDTCLEIPFLLKNIQQDDPPGFVSRRMDFDNSLVNLVDQEYATFLQDTSLEHIEQTDDGLHIKIKTKGEEKLVFAKMIVGAEGRSSIVAKKMAQHKVEPAHYSAGIRAYYKNVTGLHDKNYIELHFLKELQPGYFWIFPLPGGSANVGVGMLSKSVSAKKANLKQLMEDVIQKHPGIKKRFTGAVIEGDIEGWGLPLGSKKRRLSGERFLLTGDAGSLIDPFTGEGIGNAMVSGLVAARVIKKAVEANDFSAAFLQQYDRDLYRKLWTELKLSHYLQILTSKPRLFNFVIGKASKSKELRETISCMFENVDIRKKFTNPLFYLKILLNK
ncbi:MAG: geranylgeranyl reductase family protein [Ferruginibacter sp.]